MSRVWPPAPLHTCRAQRSKLWWLLLTMLRLLVLLSSGMLWWLASQTPVELLLPGHCLPQLLPHLPASPWRRSLPRRPPLMSPPPCYHPPLQAPPAPPLPPRPLALLPSQPLAPGPRSTGQSGPPAHPGPAAPQPLGPLCCRRPYPPSRGAWLYQPSSMPRCPLHPSLPHQRSHPPI